MNTIKYGKITDLMKPLVYSRPTNALHDSCLCNLYYNLRKHLRLQPCNKLIATLCILLGIDNGNVG